MMEIRLKVMDASTVSRSNTGNVIVLPPVLQYAEMEKPYSLKFVMMVTLEDANLIVVLSLKIGSVEVTLIFRHQSDARRIAMMAILTRVLKRPVTIEIRT